MHGNRFVPLLGGQTDARCNFAYRTLPDEATLNANPLWDPLPPESALGPRAARVKGEK